MTTDTANIITTSLPMELRPTITTEHEAAQSAAADALAHAIRCGELLIEAKRTGKETGKLPHGHFRTFVENVCRIPYPTAARYMRAARQKSTGVEVSSLRHVFESGKPEARRARTPSATKRSKVTKPANVITMTNAPDITTADDITTTDRTAMLDAIKASVITFADRYGWDAVHADLVPWIEGAATKAAA